MKKNRNESVWKLFSERSDAESAFEAESDRAVSLITAAFLDDGLEALLRRCLIEDRELADDLFSFNGPFGSFSSRINSAYAMGNISETTYKDLHIIRGVRNDFAHSRQDISFQTQSIKDRIMNLSFPMITLGPEIPNFECPRTRYVSITSFILNKLQAREQELTTPIWPKNKA